ncbi:MAG TPA: response regulator [Vicinamibacterales bacterium]|nr:response regulator [Vicinamibacterales bacterium]
MADENVFVAFALRAANSPGDACIVHLRDAERGTIRMVACHHRRAEATALLASWLSGRAAESVRTPWAQVMQTGQTRLVPVAGPGHIAEFPAGQGDLYLSRCGVQSILIVPLRLGGDVVGAVTLLRDLTGASYTSADWETLRRLTDGLARALARHEAGGLAELAASAQPLVDVHAAARARHRAKKAPEGEAPTIVLVEDEDSVRELVREILQREGYVVLAAETAEQALAVIGGHSGRLDLLLTDVVMPGMSGIALAERLRESHPDLGALYMSGYVDQSLADAGDPSRATRFLQKPFTLEALLRSVRGALEGGTRN